MKHSRRTSLPATVVQLLAALALVALAGPSLGTSVRAATGDGVPGVFVAGTLRCVQHPGHESCGWEGTFRSDDGTVVREVTYLHGSGRDTMEAGERERAYDVGRASRVYGPGGSREWMLVAGMLLAAGAFAARACVRLHRRYRSERPEPSDARA